MIANNEQIKILLNGCRNNDRASQKHLYEMLKGLAIKTCYAYAAEPIEETANLAFMKLFKNIHQFDESRHDDMLINLKAWFKRILINTCIDQLRKKASYKNIKFLQTDNAIIPDSNSNGLDNLYYKEILESIRELSPAYRSVFNLFVIEGLSHEEIALQLGISVGTSKSNLFKAREKLKSMLAKKANCKAVNEKIPTQQYNLSY